MTRFAGGRLGSAVTKVLVCRKCGQSPPLPSPPLPSPPLPSPPLPPSLPPSRVPNLINLGPAVWPKRASVAPPWRSASGHFDQAGSSRLAEARECGAALAISEWKRRQSAMIVRMHSETVFFWSGITRAVIRIGTNEWPSTRPEG